MRFALNIEKTKDKARKVEGKGQLDKAIELYQSVLDELDGTPELDNELALFNKVGDLYLKLGNTTAAVETYERAVTLYTTSGFENNAIALCNKILRNAPGRTPIYLKLAKLMQGRGFAAEAKKNLIEYAERMQKAGQLHEAFHALKEFADMSPDSEDIHILLAEQLKKADLTDEMRQELEKAYAEAESSGDERRARSTLTNIKAIDPDFDPNAVEKPKAAGAKKDTSGDLVFLNFDDEPAAAATAVEAPPPAAGGLEIEPTSLVEEEPELATADAGLDLEPTSLVEEPATDVGGLDLEPTSLVEEEPELAVADAGLDLEPTTLDELEEPVAAATDDLPMLDEIEPELAAATEGLPGLDLDEPLDLDVEVPTAGGAPEIDLGGVELEEPGELAEAPVAAPDLDEFIIAEAEPAPPAPPAAPDRPTLEARLVDDPDNASLHRSYAELLIEHGERGRGLEELDTALRLAEEQEEWSEAEGVLAEILRLEPDSVLHHQKRVEFAFRRGDKGRLADAYLKLADALFRSGASERARKVYERVLENEPDNEQAKLGLATIEPEVQEAAPAAASAPPTGGDGFVDLGAMILDDEPAFNTRMRIEEEEPTGDEERDFSSMLTQFKRGIEENVAEEDWQAHYDLGVAFKEMGLLDEAVGEFQKALRAPEGRLKTGEALGLCFYEKGQYSVAATVLRRAVESEPGGDEAKIGLLYWLGRCQEEQQRGAEALPYYQRVFAIDIGFQDVKERVKSLASAGS